MELRYTGEGSFSSRNYYFNSKDEQTVSQLIHDEIAEYFLKTFPKKFERIDREPKEPKPPKEEPITIPVTKKTIRRRRNSDKD